MSASSWMRTLPNGKAISALGFGCSSLWAKPGFDEGRAQRILETALAGGINHFDTSPSYGAGVAERRLAQFLARHGTQSLVVSTKVGSNLIDGEVQRGFSRSMMERSLDASMKRLGVDHVDILYLHGPSITDLEGDIVHRFFDDQKAAGRISFSGVESASAEVVARVADSAIDVAMPHFNVSTQSLSRSVASLAAAGKIVISGTALAQMKFDVRTFLPTSRNAFWYMLRMIRNDPLFWWRGPALARRLRRTGQAPHVAAISFVVTHPDILSGLFGSSNPDHVADNARTGREIAGGPHEPAPVTQ